MVSESVAILAVLLLILFIMLKGRWSMQALFILPFFSVPLFYLLSWGLPFLFGRPTLLTGNFPLKMVLAGGVVGCLITLCLARGVVKKHHRLSTVFLGCFFSLALTAAYLVNLA